MGNSSRSYTGATFGGAKRTREQNNAVGRTTRERGLLQELRYIFRGRLDIDDVDYLARRICAKDRNLKVMLSKSVQEELELMSFECCSQFLIGKSLYLGAKAARVLKGSPMRFKSFPPMAFSPAAIRVIEASSPIRQTTVVKRPPRNVVRRSRSENIETLKARGIYDLWLAAKKWDKQAVRKLKTLAAANPDIRDALASMAPRRSAKTPKRPRKSGGWVEPATHTTGRANFVSGGLPTLGKRK